ncbi:MAG: hypothetical protein IJA34_12825 [Lachnospiraceae bacterium]|nr:hypothetical protein [Lachnospiraceae bacterium]
MNNNDKKAMFHEALTFLVESANINSGVLTMDEIKDALDGLIEDESMYTLVYDYLAENKIKIQGYISYKKNNSVFPKNQIVEVETLDDDNFRLETSINDISSDTENEDVKEQSIVNMYLEDINNAIQLTDEDELDYLNELLTNSGDKNIVNRLTETNLKFVPDIANEYKNKGVTYGDLLQEGNLGLLEGIMTYNNEANLTKFHSHLIKSIKNAMHDAILEQNTAQRIDSHVADRANELDRASINLSKELDRTPTLEELAKYLSLPEDEVERIMKMSLDALTIDNSIEENS